MAEKKDLTLASELDRVFDEPFWSFNWPSFQRLSVPAAAWSPKVDVFAKDQRLVTRIDLPGVKKEDVTVEVIDGYLTMAGERKRESEERKKEYFRSEREYGSFYRAVPLPDGVTIEDVKAVFANGVLEVSVPLPAKEQNKAYKVEIQEPEKTAQAAKTAA